MKQPFYEAANAVIKMYALRQERASVQAPPHSPAEIYWACEMLQDIACAAAYAGSREAVALRAAIDLWNRTEKAPELFIEEEAE
ncbi:hypothetical protein KGP26_20475 [Serratia sp. JSRIV002]|uniref:hypothetical protein n=1 Tax=Serratia sp. JSRIV002 TaxID=2831894 RepID=UPI001CBD0FE0|nr:hypothetical protein [Serratia sp. JSRIV002]UAN50101.1 hypothetical protein KGP26_20475 [Serratia sp. JSRIV002]